MRRRLAAFLTVCCSLLVSPVARGAAPVPQSWIAVSDIHFSPYVDSKLTERLASAPPERWRAIFATAEPMAFSNFGSDTNYALLESTLDAMKTRVRAPQIVVITGDFLAHNFRQTFDAAVKDRSDAAYAAFVDKTIAFLALEFRATFPGASILPVVGNNDDYCGDYASAPRSYFFLHMAQAFAPNVRTNDKAGFVAQFVTGGYYTVPLPAGGATGIVLDDVFWSWRYNNVCGDRNADPGKDELDWLQSTLAKSNGPTWVFAHIPPGIDAFATLRSAVLPEAPVVPMLDPKYNDPFVALLAAPSAHVVMSLAGHTHMNAYRIVGAPSRAISGLLMLPAVSPVFSNNPAFTVLDVDANTANLLDQRVFVLDDLPLLAKDARRAAKWRLEYDFNAAYGTHGIDGSTLGALQQAMFFNDALRKRFAQYYDGESGRATISESQWRSYWCANVAMTATDYRACAMPQVQASLPPHPPAPATPAPSPAPTSTQ